MVWHPIFENQRNLRVKPHPQMDLTDTYRVSHTAEVECTFFSGPCGTFFKTVCSLAYKSNLPKYRRTRTVAHILSDHNAACWIPAHEHSRRTNSLFPCPSLTMCSLKVTVAMRVPCFLPELLCCVLCGCVSCFHSLWYVGIHHELIGLCALCKNTSHSYFPL